MMSDLGQWSVNMLRVRWHYLSNECWGYDEVDNYWYQMMDERQEIEDELELRGYKYDLITDTWDTERQ